MKGLQLPVNMIVILAIAVFVVVIIFTFFAGQSSSGIASVSSEKHFALACAQLRGQYGCDQDLVNEVFVNADGKNYYLSNLCRSRGTGSEGPCAQLCGCPYEKRGKPLERYVDRSNPGVVTVDVFSQA